MGTSEEGRIQISTNERKSRHSACGRYEAAMEDDSVLEAVAPVDAVMGVAEYWDLPKGAKITLTDKPSSKQVGGNHYKDMPIQPSEYITKNGLGWYEGNAIKYVSRYKQKGGKADIEKAIHYLELLLESLSE